MIKTEQLYYLTELDKTRSFHRCADALFISQPAISRSIKNLEKELDVTLLERSSAGVVPTAVGEKIIQKSNAILSELEALYLLCAETQSLQQGLTHNALHISAFKTFTALFLSPLVTNLQKDFPSASFFFHEHSHDERLAFVARNPYHIGFDYMPVKASQDVLKQYPDLQVMPLCEVSFYCRAKKGAPFVSNEPIDSRKPRTKPIPVAFYSQSAEFFREYFRSLIDNHVIQSVFETSTPRLYNMYLEEGFAAAIVPKLGDYRYITSLPTENYVFMPIRLEEQHALFFFSNKGLPTVLQRYIFYIIFSNFFSTNTRMVIETAKMIR